MRYLLIILLAGCSTVSMQQEEIANLWAFARAHKTFEREDSRDVRYVENIEAACSRVGVSSIEASFRGFRISACTVLDIPAYSYLPLNPTAMEIAHEASHRVYGDWHHGYFYVPHPFN